MYKCPNCGGEMEFLPESGKIKCQYCGSVFSPEESFREKRKNAQEYTEPEDVPHDNSAEETAGDRKVFICSQCGATLFTAEDTGITFCSFCGSQAFLESRIRGSDGVEPDLLIPFSVSKEQCIQIYKDKIKSAWFLPKKMKADTDIDKFRGIYMPCWVYGGEAVVDGVYSSVKTTRSGEYDIVKTYKVNAQGKGVYAGFVRDATSSFPDGIMQEIAPYDMDKAVQFNDRYITGFYADVGNVPESLYEDEIGHQIDSLVKKDIFKEREIRSCGVSSYEINSSTDVNVKITDKRKGFFPVWFLSNKNNRTGLMSYAVVNGLTGKIHADLPIDMKKYLLVALLIAIPVFLALQFFTMKPGVMLIITMLMLGVLMFFSTKMVREAYIREHNLDDEGYLYLEKEMKKSRSEKTGYKTTTRRKMNSKVRSVLYGLLCFVVIPILTTVITYAFNFSFVIWGFVAGFILFIILTSISSGNTGSETDFEAKKKIRFPFYMIVRSVMLPLLGIVIGLVVTIIDPASDLYFYLASILCSVILIVTVLDFTRRTNRLSMRRPAQLGKRGGDENE